MAEQDDQTARDTSLRVAFKDSMDLATRWNGLVDEQFDQDRKSFMKSAGFQNFAIKANAVSITPVLWAARKFGMR